MIQLPSKIRTVLFNTSIEPKPQQLFSDESDRIAVFIYVTNNPGSTLAVGRSGQAVLNAQPLPVLPYSPLVIYGPEPLWIGFTEQYQSSVPGYALIHAIYHG